MRTVISAGELDAELTRSGSMSRRTRRQIWTVMRSVSLAGERGIKDRMPKRTGRATASWGHWTPGDIRIISTNTDFGPGDAFYREDEAALEIEQGTNVGYVEQLNEGWSQQAPAGFIDLIAEKAERELEMQIDRLADED